MTETATSTAEETTPPVEKKKDDPALTALLDSIAPVTEKKRYVKFLLYGEPGVGKTVFGATGPKPLLIESEKEGDMSLLNHPELRHVKVMPYINLKQLEILAEKAHQGHFDEYETFIIDTATDIQRKDLDHVLKLAIKKDINRDPDLLIGPDYNKNTERLRRVFDQIVSLDKHIIIIAHVKEAIDQTTGVRFVRPELSPKVSGTFVGMCNVVGYMTAAGEGDSRVRSIRVHPSAAVTAKTRIGGLPLKIDNPTFDIFTTALDKYGEVEA